MYISASLTTLLDQLVELHQTETGPDRLVREAAQGHADVVKDIVLKFPDKVFVFFIFWEKSINWVQLSKK